MEASISFQPARGHRLSTQIAEQLQTAIFSGAIPEGARLPHERELVERFEASRASVQEAIHLLESQGLVTIRRGSNGGAFVSKPDFAKVTTTLQRIIQANRFDTELYQARQLIEPEIAAIAASAASADHIAALKGAVEASKQAFERSEEAYPLSRNFHFLIARATGNDLLLMLVSSLLSVRESRLLSLQSAARNERICAHAEIVDAIERRDAEAAKRITAAHLQQLVAESMRPE